MVDDEEGLASIDPVYPVAALLVLPATRVASALLLSLDS